MKKWYYAALIFCAAAISFLTSFLVAGCKSQFKPVWLEQLPPECNMTLNEYKLYYESSDKSVTVIGMDYCFKKLHREYCRQEVFGKDEVGNINPVDYNDTVKYRNYSQCLTEIK